jgi:hypothetical protein
MLALWTFAAALGAPPTAVPVALPAAEDRELWHNALALAGLRLAPPGPTGPGAQLVAADGTWTGWVRDAQGVKHPLTVAAPDDRAEREALAAMIASLVRPVNAPQLALPPLPSAAPRPVPKSAVAPLVEPELPSAAVVAVAPPVLDVAPPSVAESPLPPLAPLLVVDVVGPRPVVPDELLVRSPVRVGPWFAAGPALRVRGGVRTAGSVVLAGGVASSGDRFGWRGGLVLEAAGPADVLVVERDLAALDGKGLVALTAGRWDVGGVAGASARYFPGGVPLEWGAFPVVGGQVGYTVPLGPIGLRIGVTGEWDLREVHPCPPADDCSLPSLGGSLGLLVWRQ